MTQKKHLFGTSEKSDFIVNMTKEGVQKMCGVYCMISLLLLAVCAIPYYLTKDVLDYTDTSVGIAVNHYLSEKFIAIVSSAVIFTGILSFMIFAIVCVKKEFTIKGKAGLLVLGAVIVLTAVSMFCGNSVYYGFFGYINRSDGFLVFLGNVGFLALGMIIMGDKWKKRVADTIVGVGIFQSVVGIIQSFVESFPSYFAGLFNGIAANITTADIKTDEYGYMYTDDLTANGFVCSPFSLAAVLTICFAVAMGGAMYDKSKVRKLVYTVACGLFAVASVLTHVLPALIGIPCVIVILLAVEAVRLKTGNVLYTGKALENPIMRGLLCFLICGAVVAALVGMGKFKLCDEKVMFTDSFVKLSCGYHERGTTDTEVYANFRSDGLDVISRNKLWGTGPDCCSAEYGNGIDSDRFYNEYIDFMAQKGIVTFTFYALFLLITLVRAVKACIGFIRKEQMWLAPAAAAGVFAYLAQAYFSTTSTSSTYMMWLAMGFVWSASALTKKQKKKAK